MADLQPLDVDDKSFDVNDEPQIYTGDDVIDTSTLFPGLRLIASDLFVVEQP